MSMRRATLLATVLLVSLLYLAFFPRIAGLIADKVPFAHLIFAPLGNTLISTIAFAMVLGWFVLSRLFPSVVDHTARFVARVVASAIGVVWIVYAAFWMLLYWRGGV